MTQNKLFKLIFILVVIVNLIGVYQGIFIADSALYAAISKTILTSGNWLELFVDGVDWLDKPHFTFWCSALSMKIFGINSFGYKLPSFFFFLLSLWYTYKFSIKVYSKEVALVSVLVLSSALHIIVSNNDVRAEATMLGLIMGSTYHFYNLTKHYRLRDVLFGSLLAAAAIMTKGVFIVIPIGCAVFGEVMFTRNWKVFLKMRWVWSLLFILIFIIPEVWSVYFQFDLHPEKTVFGNKNVSGVSFFFWDSQFGRFFNTGPITGKGDVTFFLHTLLWAFAPWAIIAYVSLYKSIVKIVKQEHLKEYATLCAFMSMLVIFSLSKFQLPHYINIILPFLSVIVADYIVTLTSKGIKLFRVTQIINIVLLLVISVGLFFYFQPGRLWLFVLLLLFVSAIGIYIYKDESNPNRRLIYYSVLLSIYIGLFLNIIFYPSLLTYQSGTNAANYVNENYSEYKVGSTFFSSLFEFYIDEDLIRIKNLQQLKSLEENTVVFTNKEFLEILDSTGIKYTIIEQFDHYHITRLSPAFLNPATRKNTLLTRYVIDLK